MPPMLGYGQPSMFGNGPDEERQRMLQQAMQWGSTGGWPAASGPGYPGAAAASGPARPGFMDRAGEWIANNPNLVSILGGLGSGLLQASGRNSGMTPAQGMGLGIQQGLQLAGQNQRMRMMQKQAEKEGMLADRRLAIEEAKLSRTRQGEPERFGAPVAVMGPEGKPIIVQPGSAGTMKPWEGYAPVPEAGAKPMNVGAGLLYDPATGQTTEVPGLFAREKELKVAGRPSVQTNVSPNIIYEKTEGEALKEMFGPLGKNISEQQSQAQQTADTARNIGSLNRELQGVPTGTGADLRLKGLKALEATGMAGPEQKAEIAKMESAKRLSGGMVMDQLNAMKGPATERERDYLEGITPGLATTEQGRAAMEAVARHQQERARAKADAAAGIANEVQQRALPIGEAQKRLRDANTQIDSEYDKKFAPPKFGQPSQQPAAPGGANPISIDKLLEKYGKP